MHRRLVPSFKRPQADLPENRVYNHQNASLRFRSEHTIGLVKERFQGLKEIRLRLRRPADVARVSII